MNSIEQGISILCKVILWISTVVIFFILAANTILRYITGTSLQWANEVPELLFPWMVMAGVVLASLRGAHITTSFLMDKLRGNQKRFVLSLGWLVVSILYAVLSYATYQMLEIVHDEKSPILQVPGSVTYGCVMVGTMMLSVLALFSAWRAWSYRSETNLSGAADGALKVHW